MKTLTNRMDELLESLIDCDFRTNIGIDKAKTLICRSFKDHDKTRIKELTNIGEFKTAGEAKEYCRFHGVEIYAYEKVFQIAGALMDARKDQDKITRHACVESVNNVPAFIVFTDGTAIDKDDATFAIMNTASIKED